MADTLLLEIGCEELPTSYLDGALAQLADIIPDELAKARITAGSVRVLGTPRRLAVLVHDVPSTVEARETELLGPAESAARTADGAWTKAAEGFARKNELRLEDLSIADTPKGRYLRAVKRVPGAETRALLPGVLTAACARVSFAKAMRWANLDTAFGRPVQWLVALLGGDVVPFSFAGISAGRTTRGHRFLSPAAFELAAADDYLRALANARVQADVAERRAAMMHTLRSAAENEGGMLREDAFLEREVAGLVEKPFVVLGRFDEAFLELPDLLVESVMRHHQRYFAVQRRDGSGRLLPVFLTVVNTALDSDTVRRGNERVMRARLSDAAFFVAQDRKNPLAYRVAALDAVVFHAKLGSYGDKTRRMAALSEFVAERFGTDRDHAKRAATLAKADLVTLTVGEFPELQGEMGRFLATHDGEAAEVATAIGEHYLPRGATDGVAPSREGAVLALVDRIDTLVGCLGAGLRPTGSEDPFGLRRLANGIVRTLLHHRVNVSLKGLASAALSAANDPRAGTAAGDTLVGEVVAFCADRLRALLDERFGRDLVRACMAAGADDPVDVEERVAALATFWSSPAAADLGVAFKRVFNISRSAPSGELGDADVALLTAPAEVALLEAFTEARTKLAALWKERRHVEALELVARTLRAPVDRFFTEVFVMDKDETLRAAKLKLLGRIADSVGHFAQFDALDG